MLDLTLLPIYAAIFVAVLAAERGGELPDLGLALGCTFLMFATSWVLGTMLPLPWPG